MAIRNTEDMLKLGYVILGKRKVPGVITLALERHGMLVSTRDIGIGERSVSSSALYRWLSLGNSFRCEQRGDEVTFTATGRARIQPPREVMDDAKRTCTPVTWERDGFVFKTSYGRVIPGNRVEAVTSIVRRPDGYAGGLTDPLYEQRTFEGRGPTLRDAMEKALKNFGV